MTIPANCETPHYAPGKFIDDRYLLEEFIGAGGMACVYKAMEVGNPHQYAIKFLKPEYHNQDYLIKFFEQEADNMTKLAHPNIVRFYRFVGHPDYSYIVMDYIEGYSLTEIIRSMYAQNRHIPLDEVMRIMVQVARALDTIHRERFVHRDIKPANVMISTAEDSKGKAFLGDLGIAGTFETEIVGAGTMAYMAPEQHKRGLVDHRADIYAFGILFFELIARQRPFDAEKNLDFDQNLIERKRQGLVPNITDFREGLPDELNSIMKKVLAPHPDLRYNSVLEFTRAVHDALKPQLSADLQDFNTINYLKIGASSGVSQPSVTVPNGTNPKTPSRLSTPATAMITLTIVALFFLFLQAVGNNSTTIPTPTLMLPTVNAVITEAASPTDTATNTPTTTLTFTLTPTITSSPTPTQTNTATATNTATHTATLAATDTPTATSSPTPTPTLTPTATATKTVTPSITPSPIIIQATPSPGYLLARDAAALITISENEPLIIPGDALPIYLQVGSVDAVIVEMTIANRDDIERYGILFAVQNEQNFYRFVIDTALSEWQIERVNIATASRQLVQSGSLEEIEDTLQLTLQNQTLSITQGADTITFTADETLNGQLALFAIGTKTATLTLDSLSIYLTIANAAAFVTASPTPASINLTTRLALDIQTLLETGSSATFTINCRLYRSVFEHIQTAYSSVTDASLLAFIADVENRGGSIYSRCLAEGTDVLNYAAGTGLQDYTTWERALQETLKNLAALNQ